MKKLLTGVLSAVVLTTGLGVHAHAEKVEPINDPKLEAEILQLQAELFEDNRIDIMKDDVGYVVLDAYGNTVVTQVVKSSKEGSEVVNLFDKKDKFIIDNIYKKGTILLVTHDGDQVTKVKKNDKNIADKVIGQKITKDPIFTYKVNKVSGNKVTATSMSYFSPKAKTITLKKNSVKGGFKKGDVALVTLDKKDNNKVKSVKKLKQ